MQDGRTANFHVKTHFIHLFQITCWWVSSLFFLANKNLFRNIILSTFSSCYATIFINLWITWFSDFCFSWDLWALNHIFHARVALLLITSFFWQTNTHIFNGRPLFIRQLFNHFLKPFINYSSTLRVCLIFTVFVLFVEFTFFWISHVCHSIKLTCL